MIPLALISASLLLALFVQQRIFNAERQDWTKERSLLLTRIQHPEFVVAQADQPVVPDSELMTAEQDDIDLIGTINNG